jgi:CheY-like chemotaxis protein
MLNVLIVEDEQAIANLIYISLSGEGYRCTCAYDGKQGGLTLYLLSATDISAVAARLEYLGRFPEPERHGRPSGAPRSDLQLLGRVLCERPHAGHADHPRHDGADLGGRHLDGRKVS